jgi:hypothetical protein
MEPTNHNQYNTPIQNMVEGTKRDGTVGPLIGSIIIVLIILVGGLYFWGSLIVDRTNQLEVEDAARQQEEATQRALDEQAARRAAEQDALIASSTVEAELDLGE